MILVGVPVRVIPIVVPVWSVVGVPALAIPVVTVI
jgi:hypothetical protein